MYLTRLWQGYAQGGFSRKLITGHWQQLWSRHLISPKSWTITVMMSTPLMNSCMGLFGESCLSSGTSKSHSLMLVITGILNLSSAQSNLVRQIFSTSLIKPEPTSTFKWQIFSAGDQMPSLPYRTHASSLRCLEVTRIELDGHLQHT